MAFPTWAAEQYSTPASDQSMEAMVRNTHTEWVQLVPTWYQFDQTGHEIFPEFEYRTATDESLRHAIRRAHGLGLKVMLKPHVDAQNGAWRGTFQPSYPGLWFESYEKLISGYARMAEEEGVELLCIGCEFMELTVSEFTPRWREIIRAIRKIYSGPLVYAANWQPEFERIEFWDELDFAGIDAYVPLTQKTDPTMPELLAGWTPHLDLIEAVYNRWKTTILVTEIGYRSIDGANMHPWDWEITGSLDLAEQAQCYQAAISALEGKPWLAGIYWWNWEPDPSLGGPYDTGYTPCRKPAEKVLAKWYSEPSPRKSKPEEGVKRKRRQNIRIWFSAAVAERE